MMNEASACIPKCGFRNLSFLFLICLFLVGICVFERWPVSRHLEVIGLVVDMKSDQPVKKAKVIVSAWDYGWFDTNPRKFGFMTNSEGRFCCVEEFNFLIRKINVEVCTPSNEYRFFNVRNHSNTVLKIGESKPKEQILPSYQDYSRFTRGRWARDVTFSPSPERRNGGEDAGLD